MIKAEIVADSIGPSQIRLTTFVLTYPRFIHAELMTHRVFSRNASSSRAIPVTKQIEAVTANPAIPLAFTKNQKGMQGGEALDGKAHEDAVLAWLTARDRAVEMAYELVKLEVHKQYANRILEPWSHITVVLSATDFDNWFALRCHEMAQPEIHALADEMYALHAARRPDWLDAGQWHLPFIDAYNLQQAIIDCGTDRALVDAMLVKRSVAKCARVSYLNHDGTRPTAADDLALYQRLVGSHPLHASPAEHQAMAIGDASVRSGNFRGWIQYRKTLKDECVNHFKK
jgi:thymidylate synthase ThyX